MSLPDQESAQATDPGAIETMSWWIRSDEFQQLIELGSAKLLRDEFGMPNGFQLAEHVRLGLGKLEVD